MRRRKTHAEMLDGLKRIGKEYYSNYTEVGSPPVDNWQDLEFLMLSLAQVLVEYEVTTWEELESDVRRK